MNMILITHPHHYGMIMMMTFLIMRPLMMITYDDHLSSRNITSRVLKLLIDELDLPESNNVLPFPECDSVFYEDFSEVDALSSTNNEDKYVTDFERLCASRVLSFDHKSFTYSALFGNPIS
ncbi:hypothetical protein Tco_1561545 [Tanacetum coccineum]